MSWSLLFNERVVAALVTALVGGGVVAMGWIVTHRQAIRRDDRLRRERVRDVQGAIMAEIKANVAWFESMNLAEHGEAIVARILEGRGYFPVVPTQRNSMMFKAIVNDISILPFYVVAPVVAYYRQLAVIAAMIEDLRSLDIARIGPDRAAAMYGDYIAMLGSAIEIGHLAMESLSTHLSGGDAALEKWAAEREKAAKATAKSAEVSDG